MCKYFYNQLYDINIYFQCIITGLFHIYIYYFRLAHLVVRNVRKKVMEKLVKWMKDSAWYVEKSLKV